MQRWWNGKIEERRSGLQGKKKSGKRSEAAAQAKAELQMLI